MSQSSTKFIGPAHVPYSKPEFVRFSDNSGSGEKFDGVRVRAYEYKVVKNGAAVPGFATHWSTANRPEEEQVRLFHERDYLTLHQANHHMAQCIKYLQAQAEYNLTVNKMPELTDGQKELLAKYPHYYKDVRHLAVLDVYRVIDLWEMTNGCQQHALKKVMLPGQRKKNDLRKDVREARDTLNRWLEMLDENHGSDQATLEFDTTLQTMELAAGKLISAGMGVGINAQVTLETYNYADRPPCEAMCGYVYVAPVLQSDMTIREAAPILLQRVEQVNGGDTLYHFLEMEGQRKVYPIPEHQLGDVSVHFSKRGTHEPVNKGR